MTRSRIEWTDRSDWNPIRGCTRVSPGCVNCYAEAMAARFSDPGMWGHGFATRTPGGARWTGKVEVQWDRLTLPLNWRKPARIFASSTSDWFHQALPMEEIATLTAVAIAAVHLRGHTIQVLTKRADRMRAVTNDPAFWDQVNAEAALHVLDNTDPLARRKGRCPGHARRIRTRQSAARHLVGRVDRRQGATCSYLRSPQHTCRGTLPFLRAADRRLGATLSRGHRLGNCRWRERPERAADASGLGAGAARSVRRGRRAVLHEAVGRIRADRSGRAEVDRPI